jgi:hypothetical protein
MFLSQQKKHSEDTDATALPQEIPTSPPQERKPFSLANRPASPRKFGPAPTPKSKGLAMFLNRKEKAESDKEEQQSQSVPASPLIGRATPIQIKQEPVLPPAFEAFRKQGDHCLSLPSLPDPLHGVFTNLK